MIPALLLALAVPLHAAETPEAAVKRVFLKAEKLVAAQKGKDAREIRDLDRETMGLYAQVKPFGWKAGSALASAAGNKKSHFKVRLLAVSFLGLIRDPAVFPLLEDILLDAEQDPVVRASAAQSLAGQNAPDATTSEVLCASVSRPELPREVLNAVVLSLSRFGCLDAAPLVNLVRSFGPRPAPADLPLVTGALASLGRSRGRDSAVLLIDQVAYFPPEGEARAAAIKALDARRAEVGIWAKEEAVLVVREALRSETGRWDTMLPLVRVAAALGPEGGEMLARLSRHPDAEVLAAVSEELVKFKVFEALPDLEAIVAGAMNDPRFSPRPGRPDPAGLLARIEKAAKALRLARPQ